MQTSALNQTFTVFKKSVKTYFLGSRSTLYCVSLSVFLLSSNWFYSDPFEALW